MLSCSRDARPEADRNPKACPAAAPTVTGSGVTVGTNCDTVKGEPDQDSLVGGTEDDRLYGEDGDDQMSGGAGNDRCSAAGTDTTATCETIIGVP